MFLQRQEDKKGCTQGTKTDTSQCTVHTNVHFKSMHAGNNMTNVKYTQMTYTQIITLLQNTNIVEQACAQQACIWV